LRRRVFPFGSFPFGAECVDLIRGGGGGEKVRKGSTKQKEHCCMGVLWRKVKSCAILIRSFTNMFPGNAEGGGKRKGEEKKKSGGSEATDYIVKNTSIPSTLPTSSLSTQFRSIYPMISRKRKEEKRRRKRGRGGKKRGARSEGKSNRLNSGSHQVNAKD